LVTFGVLDLASEERGGELVGLIAYDEIVAAVRGTEFLLHVLVARELVETGDGEIVFEEPIPSAGSLELVVGQDLERKMEAPA